MSTLTDDEARVLGKRLKRAAWWRRGMVSLDGLVCVEAGDGWATFHTYHESHQIPDLRDPATRGACLEVVRERWKCAIAHLVPIWHAAGPTLSWSVWDHDGFSLGHGDTEAAALVAALEGVTRD